MVKFIQTVPHYLRDRIKQETKNRKNIQNVFRAYEDDMLARKTKNSNEVEFVKQVPQDPHDRLARKTKNSSEVEFIKQVPQHLPNRLAHKMRKKN